MTSDLDTWSDVEERLENKTFNSDSYNFFPRFVFQSNYENFSFTIKIKYYYYYYLNYISMKNRIGD